MSFSDFAKLLFSYISNNQNHSDFIIYLTTQIMEAPCTKEDKQLEIDGKYNPLSKHSVSFLNKIYSGTRFIPDKNARTIIAHLDKEKFSTFLTGFPEDIQKNIESDFQKNKIEINTQALADSCANLFESILLDIVHKQRMIHNKIKKSSLTLTPPLQSLNEGAQINIPEECKVCLYCKKWEGSLQDAIDGEKKKCRVYNSEVMPNGIISCKYFKPNYSRISNYLLSKNKEYFV